MKDRPSDRASSDHPNKTGGTAMRKLRDGSRRSLLIAIAFAVPVQAEDGHMTIDVIDPPASAGAMAPALSTTSDAVILTWIEPGGEGEDRTFRLRFAKFTDDAWSEPVTIVEHSEFFANWADVPWLAEGGDGALIATWPQKTAEYTYAYDVMVARSDDGGDSWRVLGPANNDKTPTEHGFVSLIRPRSEYVGPALRELVPIDQR